MTGFLHLDFLSGDWSVVGAYIGDQAGVFGQIFGQPFLRDSAVSQGSVSIPFRSRGGEFTVNSLEDFGGRVFGIQISDLRANSVRHDFVSDSFQQIVGVIVIAVNFFEGF